MKKIIPILAIVCLFLSCKPAKTTVSGLQNTGFIEVYANINKASNYEMVIDNENPIVIQVNKKGSDKMSPSRYEITPGKHIIEILCNGVSMSKDTYIIGIQETKRIIININ